MDAAAAAGHISIDEAIAGEADAPRSAERRGAAVTPYRTSVPTSTRAERYLATLERVPAERDPDAIRAALEVAGAPALDVWIDFQRRYGGLVQMHGFNRLEWGIVHGRPHPLSNFAPDQIDASTEGGEMFVACCSCHASDHWRLDARGRLPLGASRRPWPRRSRNARRARRALWWEIGRDLREAQGHRAWSADEGARETLLANLRPHFVPEVVRPLVSPSIGTKGWSRSARRAGQPRSFDSNSM